ncbi:MAG: Modification methylase PaeR7I [Verrucomicrobia subdivision 3 bacterium]|nr:Modification methylase PaeR7I [Limisphaerales bacterium]MCS1414941.1 Modification methylase PaeR7I [Limisphaerales bacterium]
MKKNLRTKLVGALASFECRRPKEAALSLLSTLGYESQRTLDLDGKPTAFLQQFDARHRRLQRDKALFDEWKSIELLFQLTDDEVRDSGRQADPPFDSSKTVDNRNYKSYLFFVLHLKPGPYTRSNLSDITREINLLFDMPVMLLIKNAPTLTLAIINRRLSKRDPTRDVVRKVTLIRDINYAAPNRAHIEILLDLSFPVLRCAYTQITTFSELHDAWGKTLDIQALNKSYFEKIRNWFYWARTKVAFPNGARKDADGGDSESLIRLLTRLIFCWFLKEMSLVPEDLFRPDKVGDLLNKWRLDEKDPDGRYYKAILQNLFFATLNTPVKQRRFRTKRSYKGRNKDYGDQAWFRYCDLFKKKAPVEDLYKSIPFLNGGLFENLDRIPGHDANATKEVRIDGFSDVASKQPSVPDYLFFGEEREAPEIKSLLGESRPPKVRGLIHIFNAYKFTVEENTPLEEDIALDPELLGRVFENLLAAVNPETGIVARKSNGSFYTPRKIVNYMVEETLVRRLETQLSSTMTKAKNIAPRLRELFSETAENHCFKEAEAEILVDEISRLRILDPACGSGAFPMGILHRLVHALRKLDPKNERWKKAKLETLPPEMRKKTEQTFKKESFDYTRKLELIRDCIHGVDIQPTAIQISKLRFFLSLVIEQKGSSSFLPLPNLETKFVCANTLLGLPHPEKRDLFRHQIEAKEKELLKTRSRYFFAETRAEKEKCKEDDTRLRKELADFIKELGGSVADQLASEVAAWDPYRSDNPADFLDPESMFGVADGFDITIGNPPYVRADEQSEWNQAQRKAILESQQYETLWEKWDLYVPFIERSYKLLRPNGVTSLIVSDAYCHAKYARKSQNWFLHNSRILRLDFLSKLRIFDAAVHNVTYFFQHTDGKRNPPERRIHQPEFGTTNLLPTGQQLDLTERVFFPEDTNFQQFSATTVLLDEICYVSVGMVVNADEKRAPGAFKLRDLVSDTKDEHHTKPFIEGKFLARWLPIKNRYLEWGTYRAPNLFRCPTFVELYEVKEKLISADMSAGVQQLRVAYDNQRLFHNHSAWSFLLWHSLSGVRNRSIKGRTRYRNEKPPRSDLPKREELEAISLRFSAKYILAVMNSTVARDFLRANRRSNIHLYPDDWKKLPIPDVSEAKQKPIIEIVDRILAKKQQDPRADISELEAKVDAMVTKLYQPASTPPSPIQRRV